MVSELDDAHVNAWIALQRTQQLASARVEEALRSAGLPALAWYDVLLELDREGDAGLRPSELEKRLLLPQYGVSRLLSRIEKVGYIRRRDSTDDGRAQIFAITPGGHLLRLKMWRIYSTALAAHVAQKISPTEAATLTRLLQKLAT